MLDIQNGHANVLISANHQNTVLQSAKFDVVAYIT